MSNAAEHLLRAAALARHGERDALLCGDERVTYAGLAASVRRAAGALASLGVRAGDRVLIAMRDTPEFAAAWLGALHAGAVPVALNNRLGEAECRHILADCQPRLVLAEAELPLAKVASSALDGFRAAFASAPQPDPYPAAPEHPAFMLYSSGTTGRPKGMLHTHRALALLGASFRAAGIGEGARVFGTSRLFFAYGLDHGLLAPLATGATAILYPDWPDADAVLATIERHFPTALFSVPTMYRRLLAAPRERVAALRSVSRFVAAGERISPQLFSEWRAATGGELLNLYGMSETFSACMVTPPGSSDGVRTGMPLPGIEVRLDEANVLWVRHPGQTAGYVNLPQLTAAHFRDGWFCTHDVFERDAAGHFTHQGRSDELVKIAGQWVQPGELEELARRAAGVTDAACVLAGDGSGSERLALFITAHDADAAVRAVQELCERSLPRFKRPRWIRAVGELPRTATGKVQRYKLREILAQELSGKPGKR